MTVILSRVFYSGQKIVGTDVALYHVADVGFVVTIAGSQTKFDYVALHTIQCLTLNLFMAVEIRGRSLHFWVNGEDQGPAFTNLPSGKTLYAAASLYNSDDAVQIVHLT